MRNREVIEDHILSGKSRELLRKKITLRRYKGRHSGGHCLANVWGPHLFAFARLFSQGFNVGPEFFPGLPLRVG